MMRSFGFRLKSEKRSRTASALTALLICTVLLSVLYIPAFAEAEAIRIAVIDTGISPAALPEEALLPGQNFAMPEWDTADRTGHGTAVAYLIHSAAPDALLIPLVWYDQYPTGIRAGGSTALVTEAVYAAVDVYYADIINISSGVSQEDPALKAAVDYALDCGVQVVSAVGNDNRRSPEKCYYPACWEGVIGVGAWDTDAASPADFSQQQGVSLLAPGVGLSSVDHRGVEKVVSGTSYATALVTGVLAVWLERSCDLSPEALREAFLASCTDVSQTGIAGAGGYGLLQSPGSCFCDVPDGTELGRAVSEAQERALVFGTSKALFSPELFLTRGMIATIFWRAEGCPEVTSRSGFSDVEQGAYYEAAVIWAEAAGLVVGTGDATFRPNELLTWAQLAMICKRYAALRSNIPASASSAVPWDEEALAWAGEAQVMELTDAMNGSAAINRGEAIIAVMRTLHVAAEQ